MHQSLHVPFSSHMSGACADICHQPPVGGDDNRKAVDRIGQEKPVKSYAVMRLLSHSCSESHSGLIQL
jgi:hypothetical protein